MGRTIVSGETVYLVVAYVRRILAGLMLPLGCSNSTEEGYIADGYSAIA